MLNFVNGFVKADLKPCKTAVHFIDFACTPPYNKKKAIFSVSYIKGCSLGIHQLLKNGGLINVNRR